MNTAKIIIGFIPFVLFSVLIVPIGVGAAAAAGLVTALVVIVATAKGGIKFLPVVQAVILLGMALAVAAGSDHVDDVLAKYGPAIAGLLVGISMIGTAATMPFTAQTARDRVPRELWHTKQFLQVNTRISLAWGLAVLVLGLCHLLGTLVDTDGLHLLIRLAINWVIPVIAFWQVMAYTKRTVAAAAQRMQQRQQPATS